MAKGQPFFQPRLSIGPVDDVYEKEADAVTDQIMRMPMSKDQPFFSAKPLLIKPLIQPKCAACEDEEKRAQLKPASTIVQKEDDEETPSPDFELTPPSLLQSSSEPDFLAMRQPFINRDIFHLWQPASALQVWNYNFNFFRRFGFSDDRAATFSNFTAPFAIDSQLKADNPTWWEIGDREMDMTTFNISLPVLEFGPNFSPIAPSWFRTIFQSGGSGVQRKCSACEQEEKVQRKESGSTEAPSIVNDVINSGGEPLDHGTRSFMESRFGYDFSKVKIHNNTVAAKSAQSINALAYTSGNSIVFNEGQYTPDTNNGKKLLAHELTHVVQQGNNSAVQRIQRQPAVTPRGTNPEDCMDGVCHGLHSARQPTSVAAAQTMTDGWLNDMLSCLNTNAPSSNASHQQEITQNEDQELRQEASSLSSYFSQRTPGRSAYRDFIENIRRDCERKKREIGIEFRYNIILDNSGMSWGYSPAANWDAIESAFSAMPPEATWLSPRLLTFRREQLHATTPTVAGETDIATGSITIFDRGFGTAPYGRSRSTGIPSTSQTIQHEVGHIIVANIPRNEYNNFFDNLLHWHHYPWAWITATNSPHANWQAERSALRIDTGFNDQDLDAWLTALPTDARTNHGNRSYYRTRNFLDAYDLNQVPTIPAFEYAATNKDDYLSELYTFCISSPEFVHQHLPSEQIIWLKRVMFNFPTDPNEILRQYAIGEPQQTEFIRRIMRVFTWQQVDTAFQQVMQFSSGGNTRIS